MKPENVIEFLLGFSSEIWSKAPQNFSSIDQNWVDYETQAIFVLLNKLKVENPIAKSRQRGQ